MTKSVNGYDIIAAVFTDGTDARYTMEIFSGLKHDPQVEYIYDPDTGQVLWCKE